MNVVQLKKLPGCCCLYEIIYNVLFNRRLRSLVQYYAKLCGTMTWTKPMCLHSAIEYEGIFMRNYLIGLGVSIYIGI